MNREEMDSRTDWVSFCEYFLLWFATIWRLLMFSYEAYSEFTDLYSLILDGYCVSSHCDKSPRLFSIQSSLHLLNALIIFIDWKTISNFDSTVLKNAQLINIFTSQRTIFYAEHFCTICLKLLKYSTKSCRSVLYCIVRTV